MPFRLLKTDNLNDQRENRITVLTSIPLRITLSTHSCSTHAKLKNETLKPPCGHFSPPLSSLLEIKSLIVAVGDGQFHCLISGLCGMEWEWVCGAVLLGSTLRSTRDVVRAYPERRTPQLWGEQTHLTCFLRKEGQATSFLLFLSWSPEGESILLQRIWISFWKIKEIRLRAKRTFCSRETFWEEWVWAGTWVSFLFKWQKEKEAGTDLLPYNCKNADLQAFSTFLLI